MRTLYLRNVPDEVLDRLARLAAASHMSVSAVAIRELSEVTRRADNPSLLGQLPDHQIEPAVIVAELESERTAR